jgi:hypothetical protein
MAKKGDSMNQTIYVVLCTLTTGRVALIPILADDPLVLCLGVGFSFAPKFKRVWTTGTSRQLRIDDSVHLVATQQDREEKVIVCAFSTPERAMKCLALWIETKGQQDLPTE